MAKMENQDVLFKTLTDNEQLLTQESHHSTTETNSNEQEERPEVNDGIGALFWLLFCSTLMFTLPFGAFFYIKDYLTNHYDMDKFHTNCYSVLGAVVTVNLIICLYVYKGFQEYDNMKKDNDKDD